MKNIYQIFKATTGLLISLAVIGCAGSNPVQNSYQSKSKAVLQRFANNVSRGFSNGQTSGRGTTGGSYNYSYGNYSQPVGGELISQAMEDELNHCVSLVEGFTPNCENYQVMAASLARCLDRVITYRNPLLTYAFKNLDKGGQQYWSYLLNFRRPAPFSMFVGSSDYGYMSQYASQGMYSGNYGSYGQQ